MIEKISEHHDGGFNLYNAVAAYRCNRSRVIETKVAVAAPSSKADALISQRSARARFILIFDASGNFIETYENPITRDFGPALATWLGEKEVDKLTGGTSAGIWVEILINIKSPGLSRWNRGQCSERCTELKCLNEKFCPQLGLMHYGK